MRVYDQGAHYRVTASAREVEDFALTWPCSGLPYRTVSFTFDKRNGDLVDVYPETFDGDAAVALSQEAQLYAKQKLGLTPIQPL